MSDTLRARLVVLLGAVGNNRSTVEQREELVDGLVELARRPTARARVPSSGRIACAAPNEANTPQALTRMSHGGEAVLPPEEPAPIEISHESLRALILSLRPKDEGTSVWRKDDGTVSLFASGGQLVGRVVLGVDGPVVRFTVPVRLAQPAEG